MQARPSEPKAAFTAANMGSGAVAGAPSAGAGVSFGVIAFLRLTCSETRCDAKRFDATGVVGPSARNVTGSLPGTPRATRDAAGCAALPRIVAGGPWMK